MKTAILQYKTHFNAAYRTFNPYWDAATNEKVFGKFENDRPAFIGHNYDLTVELKGEVDPLTGQVFNKEELAILVKKEIEDRYDHKNLYDDMNDFKNTVPTSECIAIKAWEILKSLLSGQLHITVTVAESKSVAAIYSGE